MISFTWWDNRLRYKIWKLEQHLVASQPRSQEVKTHEIHGGWVHLSDPDVSPVSPCRELGTAGVSRPTS